MEYDTQKTDRQIMLSASLCVAIASVILWLCVAWYPFNHVLLGIAIINVTGVIINFVVVIYSLLKIRKYEAREKNTMKITINLPNKKPKIN